MGADESSHSEFPASKPKVGLGPGGRVVIGGRVGRGGRVPPGGGGPSDVVVVVVVVVVVDEVKS